jgi:hypothetical protein
VYKRELFNKKKYFFFVEKIQKKDLVGVHKERDAEAKEREILGKQKETWWGSTKREMLCCFALCTFSKVSTQVHLLP